MFSTIKKIAVLNVLACIANVVSAVMVFLYYQSANISFENQVTMYLALISVPVLFISFVCSLLSLHSDLTVLRQSQFEEIAALRKRIEELEKRQ